MKIRTGFVSNSSSSSFVIEKEHLSPAQIKLIKNHLHKGRKEGKRFGHGIYKPDETDGWLIRETETTVEGSTFIDNFDMESYLLSIGVKAEHVEFSGTNSDWHWDEENI